MGNGVFARRKEILKRRRLVRRSGIGFGSDDEEDDDPDREEGMPLDGSLEAREEAIAQVEAALHEARSACCADHYGSFRVTPRGGAWTLGHAGMHIDAWQGRAVGQAIEGWCRAYKLQTTMRFDISLYGNAGAMECARYWAGKHARCRSLDRGRRRFEAALRSMGGGSCQGARFVHEARRRAPC